MGNPPQWMLAMLRENPTVAAFYRLGLREGFTAELFADMANHLVGQNAELIRRLTELEMSRPPVAFKVT